MMYDAPLYRALSSAAELPETLTGEQAFGFADPVTALRWGGLWPDGRPSRLVSLEATGELETRGARIFSASMNVVGLVNPDEPLAQFSEVFLDLEDEMLDEQRAWRRALRREGHDVDLVREKLDLTLHARGLKLWGVQQFPTVDKLRAKVDPAAFFTWGAVHAQASFEQWQKEADADEVYDKALRAAWTAWYTQDFWDDQDVAADPGANADVRWDVWDAWAALTVFFAVEEGWVHLPADVMTRGLRDAYAAGLGIAAPISPGVLGFAMSH
jgi:hypothetical protein